jgi:CHRD domain
LKIFSNLEFKSMRMNTLIAAIAGLTFASIAFVAAPAFAETVALKADLTAASTVPPNASKGTGTADVTYDAASKTLTWTVTFTGLSGDATAAHFHGPADVGANAGVAVPIKGTANPMAGSATITDAQAAELLAGKWYVNIHTAANKNGEIRGQVLKAK